MDLGDPVKDEDEHHGGQERALFLLDARPELFEMTEDGTRCERAVRQVLDYVKARLVEKTRDVVGLVACGDGRDFEAAVTLLAPAAPSAKAARALGDALKAGACKDPQAFRKWLDADDEIKQKPRSRTEARQGRLRNGLDRCARDLEDAQKAPSAVDSIYIFSAAADPCDDDATQHEACEVFARDSSDVDRELQLYYFGRAENVEPFWKPFILIPSAPPQDADNAWQERAWPALEITDVFDDGRQRAAQARGAKTVPGVELTLALGEDTSLKVVVRLRKLAMTKRPAAAQSVHGESLDRVKAQSSVLDTTTGAKLDRATDVNTYVAAGPAWEPTKDEQDEEEGRAALRRSHRVLMDAQDRDDCAECEGFLSGTVCVLGVCSVRDAFPAGLRVQNPGSSPCALSPDEAEAPGSSAVVKAFAASLREKNLVAIARYIPRRSAARRRGPKLVALEARDDGLGLVELPFDDELRVVPREDAVEPAPELDATMHTLVEALQARCMRGGPVDVERGVPNFGLRGHHAALEAFALGLDNSAVQRVREKAEALRPSRADAELVAAAAAVAAALPEDEDLPVAKKARKAPKDVKVLVDTALLTPPCDREKLKNHTNDALKACCGDLGLKKTGRKDELVERIAEHVDAQEAGAAS